MDDEFEVALLQDRWWRLFEVAATALLARSDDIQAAVDGSIEFANTALEQVEFCDDDEDEEDGDDDAEGGPPQDQA